MEGMKKYCAWSGDSTLAVANAVCEFKDGSKCDAEDFFNGTCSKGQ
jgi:putative hemolysin